MEFTDVVANRRSTRAFETQPVAAEIIERVFSLGLKAPSNCNTQPWYVHIASGAKIELLRSMLPEKFMAGQLHLDYPYDGVYEGEFKVRQYAAAQALYDSLNIAREDKVKRHEAFMRNFTFFDAPHVAFFYLPAEFGLREACDLGMFAQTVMLGLVNEGLGSCPQTALGFHAGTIKETLGIPDDRKLMFGLSFGYPKQEEPVNQCVTDRALFSDLVTLHDR
ncbi:Nitroreductase [Aequoribacter fuscus]|uniref:Nitroreductase n=1 Tax=Aequoribacter fuscus TaxID=2518989 RepID=F3KYR0_9GAMM|nr:nitroreductase [Aequoribacter fuscus]EGG30824.1 Nitroreductase [Aequoribacter fuscus]QHJ87728.1 nitroreductase [Aequoribacter fuscus]